MTYLCNRSNTHRKCQTINTTHSAHQPLHAESLFAPSNHHGKRAAKKKHCHCWYMSSASALHSNPRLIERFSRWRYHRSNHSILSLTPSKLQPRKRLNHSPRSNQDRRRCIRKSRRPPGPVGVPQLPRAPKLPAPPRTCREARWRKPLGLPRRALRANRNVRCSRKAQERKHDQTRRLGEPAKTNSTCNQLAARCRRPQRPRLDRGRRHPDLRGNGDPSYNSTGPSVPLHHGHGAAGRRKRRADSLRHCN